MEKSSRGKVLGMIMIVGGTELSIRVVCNEEDGGIKRRGRAKQRVVVDLKLVPKFAQVWSDNVTAFMVG